MNDKDQIKDLFSEKLGNFEAKVKPELWANVASQVGAASSGAATGGLSLMTKAIIGISGAAVLTTGIILYNTSGTEPVKDVKQEFSQASQQTEKTIQEAERVVGLDENNETVVSENNEEVNTQTTHPIVPVETRPVTNPTPIEPNIDPPAQILPLSNTPSMSTLPMSQEQAKEELEQQRQLEKDQIVQPNIAQEDEPTRQIVPANPSVPEEDEDIVQADEIEIEFPNVFTPNNDGRNDIYYIKDRNVDFKSFEFVVYDRRGEVVMISKDINFKWTALNPATGMYLAKNIYAYVMIGETVDGVFYKKSGTITIE